MAKQRVAWPKQLHNNMEGQSGVNLTSMTMSSQLYELETSGIADHDTMTNPPPTGGGLEAGAQESPSTSDIELEYNIMLPDKGKGKAMPDNTAQGGSGHDPPRDWERVFHLERWNKSDDHSWSHSARCCLTMRLDDKEILDRFLSRMNEIVRDLAEAKSRGGLH